MAKKSTESIPKVNKVDTIILRLRQLRKTLDYEILICRKEIEIKEIKMSKYKSSRNGRFIAAKVEKERFELALQSYLDAKKDLYEGFKTILKKYKHPECDLITDCVIDEIPVNELMEKYNKTYKETMEILANFSHSIVGRFRYAFQSQYFDL